MKCRFLATRPEHLVLGGAVRKLFTFCHVLVRCRGCSVLSAVGNKWPVFSPCPSVLVCRFQLLAPSNAYHVLPKLQALHKQLLKRSVLGHLQGGPGSVRLSYGSCMEWSEQFWFWIWLDSSAGERFPLFLYSSKRKARFRFLKNGSDSSRSCFGSGSVSRPSWK